LEQKKHIKFQKLAFTKVGTPKNILFLDLNEIEKYPQI